MARFYDHAEATIKIDKGGIQLDLPQDRRLIAAMAEGRAASLVCAAGPLTREQLDLIDIPGGSHVIDRLLPGVSKSIGETWKQDKETMQVLLGMDDVTECEVESVLTGLERGYAKVRLNGTVHGKTDGAATKLEVQASYLFDTNRRRIARMNLAFSEKREAGRIGPAVDAVGKLSLSIDALPETEHLAAEQLAAVEAVGGLDSDHARLAVTDDATGLRLLHDRQWHVTSEGSERLVLRRIDGGDFLAQCNITIRPERQEGRQSTMAEFERDVRFSLGSRFEAVVTSGEWTSATGLLCYRLVVHGKVDGLPIEWRYYLASPPAGRSVAVAVSVEPHLAEQLGDADRALVESISLSSPTPPNSTPPAASARKQDAATR
jgi:hypothetical protein